MSNSTPDLDLSLLNEIADGSDEFIVESIDMFLANTPALIDSLSGAISKPDWTVAASTAHMLKSNVGFFGMSVCQGLMQEIEIEAKSNAPDHGLLLSKFNEASGIISANFITLQKIKAELEGQ